VEEALRQIEGWPASFAAAGVVRDGDVVATRGARDEPVRWASVTKLVTTLAALVAAEEGVIDLDEPAGPEGSTVRHLLAHASGLPFEPGAPTGPPGRRRVYSNVGFEMLAEHIAARAEIPFAEYLAAGVLQPLRMGAELRGSPAADLHGSLDDLLTFARKGSPLTEHAELLYTSAAMDGAVTVKNLPANVPLYAMPQNVAGPRFHSRIASAYQASACWTPTARHSVRQPTRVPS